MTRLHDFVIRRPFLAAFMFTVCLYAATAAVILIAVKGNP